MSCTEAKKFNMKNIPVITAILGVDASPVVNLPSRESTENDKSSMKIPMRY